MGTVTYTKTLGGQLFYDLAFTDLSEPWLAKKHKIPRGDVKYLRFLARDTLIGKRKLSKAARLRAIKSAAALNRIMDAYG